MTEDEERELEAEIEKDREKERDLGLRIDELDNDVRPKPPKIDHPEEGGLI